MKTSMTCEKCKRETNRIYEQTKPLQTGRCCLRCYAKAGGATLRQCHQERQRSYGAPKALIRG